MVLYAGPFYVSYDISEPANNAKEAVQWLYFGYLAAIKTQNGAAMSVGRVSTFLDIFIERDRRWAGREPQRAGESDIRREPQLLVDAAVLSPTEPAWPQHHAASGGQRRQERAEKHVEQ